MTETALAVLVAFVSALLPVISIEVYLVGATAVLGDGYLVAMVIGAGVAQPVGKLFYYYMGYGALNLRWLRPANPGRWTERTARLRRQAENRPIWISGVLLASAFASIPPYVLMCVLAGTVRMNVFVFLGVSILGRIARFALVVFVPHLTLGILA